MPEVPTAIHELPDAINRARASRKLTDHYRKMQSMRVVLNDGLGIEYDTFGDPAREPLLLIAGLGTQMIRWSEPFCELLASKGFYVFRFDNRDCGLSTHFVDAPVPNISAVAAAMSRGTQPDVPYTLWDMTDDVVRLISELNLGRVHVVGRSMGGIIAQLLASAHPERVVSLTAIMSSTCNPSLPPPTPEALRSLMEPAPNPILDQHAYVSHRLKATEATTSPGFAFDEEEQRELILVELKRSYDPAGAGRQFGALVATGDCRGWIKSITASTLVIHGKDDALVPLACGQDIADNIPGATLLTIDGMGHDIPSALYETIAHGILENAQRASASRKNVL